MSGESISGQILAHLAANTAADAEQIATELGKTPKQVRDLLVHLKNAGKVERNHLSAWELTAEGAKAEAPAAARKATKGRQAALARGEVRKATRQAKAAPGPTSPSLAAFSLAGGDWLVVKGGEAYRVPAEVAEAIRRA